MTHVCKLAGYVRPGSGKRQGRGEDAGCERARLWPLQVQPQGGCQAGTEEESFGLHAGQYIADTVRVVPTWCTLPSPWPSSCLPSLSMGCIMACRLGRQCCRLIGIADSYLAWKLQHIASSNLNVCVLCIAALCRCHQALWWASHSVSAEVCCIVSISGAGCLASLYDIHVFLQANKLVVAGLPSLPGSNVKKSDLPDGPKFGSSPLPQVTAQCLTSNTDM